MHLLHGVGASAKMPALWHFVCINCCNSNHQNQYEIWRRCELQRFSLLFMVWKPFIVMIRGGNVIRCRIIDSS